MTKIVFNGSNRKGSSHFNDNTMMVNHPDFSNMGYSPIKQPFQNLKGDVKVNFDTNLGQILY